MNNNDLINLIEHDRKGADAKRAKQIDRIRKWVKAYNGYPYGNEEKNRSQTVWKLIMKQGESLISNLSKQFLGGHDIVELTPMTHKDGFKADLYSRLINHFWAKEFNSSKFIKSVARLAVKEGTCFVRVGWEQDVRYNERIVPELGEASISQLQNQGIAIEPLPGGQFKLVQKEIITNRPTAKPVRIEDVYLDPTADTFEDLEFLIYKYTSNISIMSKQPHLYNKEAINKLKKIVMNADDLHSQSAELPNSQYNEAGFEFSDKARKKITLYEYWGNYDIDGNGIAEPCVAVMAEFGKERVIVRLEKNTFPFKSIPFVCIPLIEDEFNIYGMALAAMIEDEQKFSTSIIRGVQDNMSMSNKGTKFVKKQALDAVNYKRLIDGAPVVEINTHEHINTAVMDGNFNQLPQSVYNMLGIIDQQAESLTGISKLMQGIPGTEMKSASSNFSAVMSQSQIRLLDMTMSLTTGLRYMFRMWAEMAVEYLDDNEILDITGLFIPEAKARETQKLAAEYNVHELPPEAQQKAMLVIMEEVNDKYDLSTFKFDVKMKVGTDGLKDIKINQINMLMQQAAPLIQAQVVPPKVLGLLLADMAQAMDRPDIAKMIERYEPQPDPIAQKAQELELANMEAEAQKSAALAENAMARSRNVDAKTQKELHQVPLDDAKKAADIQATNNKMQTDALDSLSRMNDSVTKATQSIGKEQNAKQ